MINKICDKHKCFDIVCFDCPYKTTDRNLSEEEIKEIVNGFTCGQRFNSVEEAEDYLRKL